MKVFAIGVIVASLILIMLYPTPAGGLEGQRYEGNVENYTLFAGKWDNPCIYYSAVDTELASLVDQALWLWGSVSQIENCGNFPGSPITVEGVPAGSLGAGVLGQAGCASVNGFMTGCYVRIGSNARNLSVVAHEIGHTLGMGHSQRSDQLMSAFCCAPLGSDDIAGIQALYGARVAPTPTPVTPTSNVTPTAPRPTATTIPAPVIYRRWLPGLVRD